MLPQQLQTLINQFTRLPGIGPRQAARFAFYLLRNGNEISVLENTLRGVRENITLCANCFLPANVTGFDHVTCRICFNPQRNKSLICVVEKETDAMNLEKTGYFQGCYFVLGGFIDPLERENLARQRLDILTKRISSLLYPHDREQIVERKTEEKNSIEVILALTPRREGDFTSLYIEEKLKFLKEQGLNIKITRLGRGLSSGAELEYADQDTLRNALDGRK